MSDDDREERLPKWARDELHRLRADLDYARAKLTAGPADSDTFADPYLMESRRPLGVGPAIRFEVDGRTYLEARLRDGLLAVTSSGQMTIRPKVSNSIEITTGRY